MTDDSDFEVHSGPSTEDFGTCGTAAFLMLAIVLLLIAIL